MSTRIYETRYYGPTDHRGSRVKAQWMMTRWTQKSWGENGYWDDEWAEKPAWVDWHYGVESSDNHKRAIYKAWPEAGTIRYGGETKQGMLWIVEEEEL